MNAAVSKLKKDIWKDEEPNEKGKKNKKEDAKNKKEDTKNIKITSEKGQGNKLLQQVIGDEAQLQQTEVHTLQEALANQRLMEMPMQQTAVSKIRRSIFKLPVSSPYTQYYPPEGEGETQAEQVPQNQDEKKQKSPKSSKSPDKVKSPKSKPVKAVKSVKSKAVEEPKSGPQIGTTGGHSQSEATAVKSTVDKAGPGKGNKGKTEESSECRVSVGEAAAEGDEGFGEKRELRRMKGHFYCDKCDKRWKSLHVYCEPGTKRVRLSCFFFIGVIRYFPQLLQSPCDRKTHAQCEPLSQSEPFVTVI